jgi:uncharacterized protein YdiU (UPF0061 family)
MSRECLMGKAMHALGIPTSRALAVCLTGETVGRETLLPAAVLARLLPATSAWARSSTRTRGADPNSCGLADPVIARHHPSAAEADNPYLALLESVLTRRRRRLLAEWE